MPLSLKTLYSYSAIPFLILFLTPAVGFPQSTCDTISILSNRVRMLVPIELKPMSDEMWALKYHKKQKPDLVLTDENGEVNLIADLTRQAAQESQLFAFKDFQLQQLKMARPDINLLKDGAKMVNRKKISYLKFLTQAIDQKVFNYYFFIVVDGHILFCTFNCIEKLQKQWEKAADEIVASLTIK